MPHFTSTINWVLRVGLARLNQVSPIQEPWVAVIDHSIDIGVKKAFVVLRIRLSTLKEKGGAPQLKDCECIGLKVCEKADHEIVFKQLSDVFERAGKPVAIIKDQAGNLAKGVKYYNRSISEKKIATIDDIGHVSANALKSQFEKTRSYKRFLELINIGSARLRQTSLAFLLPPKIRTKGRFQSISRLAQWGEKILDILQEPGRSKEGCLLEKLREAMPGFSRMRPFIERFTATTVVINEVSSILKNQGLNRSTYQECKDLAETLPARSKVRKRLLEWLKRHLSIHCKLGIKQTPLLVSSDIVECLFGKFKYINERSPESDINRMALIIPALCGEPVDQQYVSDVFKNTRHKDIEKWESENISHTLRKKRTAFFKTTE